jgi:hypothetical protein
LETRTIVEVKEKLNGERHEFASALLARLDDEVVSLYTLPRDGHLGGVPLPAGTRCLGHLYQFPSLRLASPVRCRSSTILCATTLA